VRVRYSPLCHVESCHQVASLLVEPVKKGCLLCCGYLGRTVRERGGYLGRTVREREPSHCERLDQHQSCGATCWQTVSRSFRTHLQRTAAWVNVDDVCIGWRRRCGCWHRLGMALGKPERGKGMTVRTVQPGGQLDLMQSPIVAGCTVIGVNGANIINVRTRLPLCVDRLSLCGTYLASDQTSCS
jgi:hypothetical protein